jgi:diaminohydroxyphosphoribosylaminopyrimidine deaminase/5-amino-6-(5-phosphoribosylamino)uracil reductase
MRHPAKPLQDATRRVGGESGSLDEYYIGRAIDLAWFAAGKTHPNPMVGALVVKDGSILGEGYHERSGEDHAESVALDRAGSWARGATLYVTLEPCVHFGKTPPCIDRILASGVHRVVVATLDPDERVNGRGVQRLRERRVDVEVGCMAEKAMLLNLAYYKSHVSMGTTVTVKMAITMDGMIASAPGRRDDISGSETQLHVQRLRAVHEGVLVGINTLLVDRPVLDCRIPIVHDPPTPVVLDTTLRFPSAYPWIEAGRRFLVCTGPEIDDSKAASIERGGGRVLRCALKGPHVDVRSALEALKGEGIQSVLVEGGAGVFSSFVGDGLWDAMHISVSPELFGPAGIDLSSRRLEGLRRTAKLASVKPISDDTVISYINQSTRDALLGLIC